MKKLLFCLIIIVFSSKISSAQIDYDSYLLKGSRIIIMEGTTLTYEVNYYGDVYDFKVTVKKFSPDGIEFDYEMTNEFNTKGSISIVKDAFENAKQQFNYFSGGPVKLDDKTSVWVSKKVFQELISAEAKSVISADGGSSFIEILPFGVFSDFDIYNSISKTKITDLTYLYASTEDDSDRFWIHFSKNNPLILGMDLGWTIWLKEMGKK